MLLKLTNKAQRIIIPLLTGSFVASGVIACWQALNQRESAAIENNVSFVLDQATTALIQDLNNRMHSLKRIAERWSLTGGTTRPAWDADVKNYIADQPGYQAIQWADATYTVRWIVPQLGNEAVQDLDLTQIPTSLATANRASKSGTVALSPAYMLTQGGLGFVAYQPVYLNQGGFDGIMIAVFKFDAWLDNVLNSLSGQPFHFQILFEDKLVYNTSNEAQQIDNSLIRHNAFNEYGRNWTVRAWAAESQQAKRRSLVSVMLLMTGLILSALLGWIVWAFLKSREQSHLLQQRTQQLETLWTNLPGMAFRSSCGYRAPTEFVSDGCHELTGYSEADFIHQRTRWDDLVHPRDESARWQTISNAIKLRQTYDVEYRIICRDGQEKWVWESGAITSNLQRTADNIEGIVVDITDRKQAETALIDTSVYANTVMDTAAEAIITTDSLGQIESINRSGEKMFGYSRADVHNADIRTLMPGPDSACPVQYLRSLQTGEQREVVGRRKDNSVFPVHIAVSEFVSKGEQKFVGLLRDLSAQHTAEQEASLHRERLAHAGRVNILGEMATGIAHEINQPLSAISMYAQSGIRFLNADNPKTERLHEVLEKLSTQAHRAGSIIERMQYFARQRESLHEEINCNVLLQEVFDLAESEALIHNTIIELDLDPELRLCVGDKVQLQQVMLNLLRNGMESMKSIDHRHGNKIILRTQDESDGLIVSVVDKGTGVPKDSVNELFKPFASNKETGMGIGLTICKSIIDSHGGNLAFMNHEDYGATFYFTLPCGSYLQEYIKQ